MKNKQTPPIARAKVYQAAMLLRSALVDFGFSDEAVNYLDASLWHISNDCKEAHFGNVNVIHEQPEELADMFVKHGIMPVNINLKGN